MSNESQIFEKFRVLDGGMGSLLSRDGWKISNSKLWSAQVLVDNAGGVLEAHKKFLQAGATVLETCSYQAGLKHLQICLNISHDDSVAILRSSVTLAKKARDEFLRENSDKKVGPIFVAGSIASYGAILCDRSEYTGDFMLTAAQKDIADYHRGQAQVLMDCGVDLLAFETIPSCAEAKIINDVMENIGKSAPYWISFYCKDANSTGHGDDFASTVRQISDCSRLSAIGVNCTNPVYITPLLSKVSNDKKPFVVYPNYHDTQSDFNLSEAVPQWAKFGAKIIGGCCDFFPEKISEVCLAVKKLNRG